MVGIFSAITHYLTSESFAQSLAMTTIFAGDNGGTQFNFDTSGAFSYGGNAQTTAKDQAKDSFNEQDNSQFEEQVSSGEISSEVIGTNQNKTVLEDGSIVYQRSKNLEHGDLADVNGIVLHHTASSTSGSTLNAYKTQSTGAHYLVDENGKIYQTADTGKVAWHVGKIRSKCQIESSCSAGELKTIRAMGFNPKALHNHEKVKSYPNRYPTNTDSIGIEIVGALKNGSYGAGNSAQAASVKSLVDALQQKYKLGNSDVYRHGVISYKHPTEGQGYGY